jgi:hypothetical protein
MSQKIGEAMKDPLEASSIQQTGCIGQFFLTIVKYPRLGNFIKQRGSFSSQFWRFQGMALAPVWLWKSEILKPMAGVDDGLRGHI